jgi:hypothetical protein
MMDVSTLVFVSGQTLLYKEFCVGRHTVMMQNPLFQLKKWYFFFTNTMTNTQCPTDCFGTNG